MTDVPERVWRFEVSGHLVLYKWLRARNGTPLAGAVGAALLREVLDITARIAELLSLFDQADAVLADALAAPLTRVDLDLPAQNGVVVDDDDDAPG